MKSCIKFLSFSAVLSSLLLLYSCGSTPKVQVNDKSPDIQESQAQNITESNNNGESDSDQQTSNSQENTPAADIQNEENEPADADNPAEKIEDSELSEDLALFEKEEQEKSQPLPLEVNDSTASKGSLKKPPQVIVLDADSQETEQVQTKNTKQQEPAKNGDSGLSADTDTVKARNQSSDKENQAGTNAADTEDQAVNNAAADTDSETTGTTADTDSDTETNSAAGQSNIDIFKNPAVIIPSRSMKIKNNQYVDVVYPGNGWIYIGETETDGHFRYFGRKLGTSDTTFTLRSMKPGKTLLHFYKNDVLTAQYIDDYLEVEVINETAKSNEKAKAPSYAEAVPPKPVRGVTQITPEVSENKDSQENKKASPGKTAEKTVKASPQEQKKTSENFSGSDTSATQEDKNVKTIIQNASGDSDKTNRAPSKPQTQPAPQPQVTSDSASETPADTAVINTNPSKSLLEQAKESLKNKKYELALAQIQSYMDSETKKIDEALYVQGQILEADSPVRSIKSAIDCYDTLIKKYPASRWWQEANKRKIYLNRYYINIW